MQQKAPKASRFRTTVRALRHQNYRLFFSGQLVSLIGTWMQTVAQSWLVYRLQGSSLGLGLVAFAGQIPVFVLGPIAGIVADRVPRQRVIIATQVGSMLIAFLLAALTLTHAIQIWHIYVLASLLGALNAFDIPSRQAFVSELVAREDLSNAIALNSSMFNGARMIGPAIAGLVVAGVGEGWCFVANGLSYFAVLYGLLRMRLPARQRIIAGSAWTHMAEGFRFVATTPPLRALILLLGFVSLMGMPYSVLMPAFAGHVLGAGSSGLGILMTASGVGALLGALMLASREGLAGLGRWIALASACFGVTLCVFSLSRSFWLSVAILVPVGLSMMIQMASSNTLVQALTPDRLRGRVMSIYSMVFMGMAPLGAICAGFIADRFGAPRAVAMGGALCVIASAIFAVRLPKLREEARRIIRAEAGSAPAYAEVPPN
jgi:MFS family permease